MEKVLLIIMDGWGISKNPLVSAIKYAKTPFIDYCYNKYPFSKILTSGINVGLPKNQVGNSEVGHMTLGAGRIIYQNLLKINNSIYNGSFKNIKIINNIFDSCKKNNTKKIHIMGLLSDGGVHSHINHLFELLNIAAYKNIKNVFIHAFMDGRDTNPKKGKYYIKSLLNHINKTTGILVTIVGRYYAMDRNLNWLRTKKAYDCLVKNKGYYTNNILSKIQEFYDSGITDEFMEPIIITGKDGNPINKLSNNDILIFFNFRTDRGRQITEALTQKDFPKIGMKKLNIDYITMTSYKENYKKINVIIKDNNIKDTLGEVLENNKKQQLRIAETEKYPHVTFFFSGKRENIFNGEKRIICNSPNVKTYDLKPEMSAFTISKKVIYEIIHSNFDFICLNFANPDMVGHTGIMKATIKACEVVDTCVNNICNIAINKNYTILILSDHGNADYMINLDGTPNTSHTTQPVPCFLISKNTRKLSLKNSGKLSDISPTILELMKLKKPALMTGKSLLRYQ